MRISGRLRVCCARYASSGYQDCYANDHVGYLIGMKSLIMRSDLLLQCHSRVNGNPVKQASNQLDNVRMKFNNWIPAFAGMTMRQFDVLFHSWRRLI